MHENNQKIACIQINLNHSKLAQDNIAGKISTFNKKQNELFIICAQEPYIHNKVHARRPLSCKVFCNKDKPRTAIYTHNNLQNTWYLENLSNRDCTVIQTRIKNRDTLIASVYLDITLQTVIPEWLDNLMTYAYTK